MPKFMSIKSDSPDSPDSPDPEASPESIEDLRSVLAGLKEEMETLESSLSDFEEPEEDIEPLDPALEDLEDIGNRTRLASRRVAPREVPEALEELGEEESDAIPDARVVFDLNPKPNPDRVPQKRVAKVESEKPAKEKVPRISKREQKRLTREEKARARAEERAEIAKQRKASQESHGGEKVDSEELMQRSMDELDLENPLPDAMFAPNREHSDLVMDRRQRRLEAVAILAKKEREQDEVWDQGGGLDEDGRGVPERRFNLPIYLVQAALVSIAGLLIVMGVRTAYKSMRDAKDGEEEQARSDAPNLRALGLIEAREVVQSYFAAGSWEAKLEFVRQPDKARPRMERYYQSHPGEGAAISGVEVLDQIYNSLEGGEGFLIRCRLPDDTKKLVPAVRIRSEAPYFVVDWEVLVDYADVGWAAFLKAKKPGSRGVFRVYAVADDYGAPFEDSKKYLGLKLYSRKREEEAYGYIQRGSHDGRELQGVLDLSRERRGGGGAGSGRRSPRFQKMAAVSDDPKATLKAMQAIRDLPDPELDDTDLFGVKNFIKPELWRSLPDFWTPMTVEVEFPQLRGAGFLPRLEIVRFLSANWIIGETRMEMGTEVPIPGI